MAMQTLEEKVVLQHIQKLATSPLRARISKIPSPEKQQTNKAPEGVRSGEGVDR